MFVDFSWQWRFNPPFHDYISKETNFGTLGFKNIMVRFFIKFPATSRYRAKQQSPLLLKQHTHTRASFSYMSDTTQSTVHWTVWLHVEGWPSLYKSFLFLFLEGSKLTFPFETNPSLILNILSEIF